MSNYLRYSGLGFQIAATVAVGFAIGHYLDKWQGNQQPYFTAAFSFMFVLIALYIGLKDFIKTK